MIEAEYLKKLGDAQAEYARSALAVSEGSAFDYGKACGFYAGLEHARSLWQGLVDEKDRRDNEL